MWPLSNDECYVSIDIEADEPIPGAHSILSLGTATSSPTPAGAGPDVRELGRGPSKHLYPQSRASCASWTRCTDRTRGLASPRSRRRTSSAWPRPARSAIPAYAPHTGSRPSTARTPHTATCETGTGTASFAVEPRTRPDRGDRTQASHISFPIHLAIWNNFGYYTPPETLDSRGEVEHRSWCHPGPRGDAYQAERRPAACRRRSVPGRGPVLGPELRPRVSSRPRGQDNRQRTA